MVKNKPRLRIAANRAVLNWFIKSASSQRLIIQITLHVFFNMLVSDDCFVIFDVKKPARNTEGIIHTFKMLLNDSDVLDLLI